MESRSGGDGDKNVNEARQRKANDSHQKTINRHQRYNEKRSPKKGRARSPVVVGNEIADSIKKLNASRSKDVEEKWKREREEEDEESKVTGIIIIILNKSLDYLLMDLRVFILHAGWPHRAMVCRVCHTESCEIQSLAIGPVQLGL